MGISSAHTCRQGAFSSDPIGEMQLDTGARSTSKRSTQRYMEVARRHRSARKRVGSLTRTSWRTNFCPSLTMADSSALPEHCKSRSNRQVQTEISMCGSM